ncbi:NCS2 family permease [Sulfurimonas sp. HSL-3221]|uniref:NCS2 family permease n=1 Tax=Thiomicrolovo TaxID=3451667 RepID=UPI001E4CA8F5|nr:NCS2 family permease [Sulfurimonas sp. HSL-3221]UFS62295.1 NCS2 family permease [Sulfurimonas sp. HSL-3221]
MNPFQLRDHGTDVRTEMTAGFTTFLAMLYIVPVNAAILSAAGLPFDAVITATAVMTIIASILNGLWANTPIAMSVGMGLNAYFSFGLVKGMGLAWQTALGIVFLSGILYILISITPLRRWMITTIPVDVKRAVSAGIGAFIAFIGMEQLHLITDSPATLVTLGNLKDPHLLIGLFGLGLAIFFVIKKVRGAFILSITLTALLAWATGVEPMPESFFSLPASMAPIAFELDITSALSLSMAPLILIFLITDLFDTLGTLTGVGMRANLFHGKDSVPLQRTIEADAAATMLSGLAGVTSTTAFIESAAGVEAGGRTGLTAVVTGLLFILPLFWLPFFQAIPSNAVYPVLIVIGVMMFGELQHIDYSDAAVKYSTFLIVLGMPLTYSITDGLLLGSLAYVFIRLIQGRFRQIDIAMGVLAAVALLVFFVL